MSEDERGRLEGILGKAEDALGRFMDDPEKVEKAKSKAEGVLGKYMDQQQASKITDTAESVLSNFARKPDEQGRQE